MNKLLAFAFVLAMMAAGILGVKWQRAVAQLESDARKAARETNTVATVRRPDPKTLQELRRMESELKSVRAQMVRQREMTAEAHQRQIQILMRENDSLQLLLTKQMSSTTGVAVSEPAIQVEVVEPEVVEEEDADVMGITVVDMNEYRQLNWRMGTMPAAGAAVVEIVAGSPAMTAGIQVGDIVVNLDNTTIDGPGMFNQIVGALLPGSATRVTLDRDRTEIVAIMLRPLE